MAVPRNRLSNSRKNSKRAHHAKTPKIFPNVLIAGTCICPIPFVNRVECMATKK